MKRQSLYILTVGEAWDRFSYYGLQAILVLYLTQHFLFTPNASYSLYGVYAALGFSSSIFGGFVGDQYLGKKLAIRLGCACIIAGNLLMTSTSLSFNFSGIALMVLGTGLFKPTATSLLGEQFHGDASQKTRAYTIFYMGMNAGALSGPIIFGLLIKYFGWHSGFYISAAGFIWTLLWFELKQKTIQSDPPAQQYRRLRAGWLFIVALLLIAELCHHPRFLHYFEGILAIVVIAYLIRIVKQHQGEEKSMILTAIWLTICGILYYSASLQIGSSVTLFTEHFVNRSLFGWVMPTSVISSFEPTFIILLAPLVTAIWAKLAKQDRLPSARQKITIGILFAATSYFIFFIAAASSQTQETSYTALGWLLLGNLILGAGELVIMPAILTTISQNIPKPLQSTMMGTWFLAIGFAGFFASQLSKISTINNRHLSNPTQFAHDFLITGMILLGCCAIKWLAEKYYLRG